MNEGTLGAWVPRYASGGPGRMMYACVHGSEMKKHTLAQTKEKTVSDVAAGYGFCVRRSSRSIWNMTRLLVFEIESYDRLEFAAAVVVVASVSIRNDDAGNFSPNFSMVVAWRQMEWRL